MALNKSLITQNDYRSSQFESEETESDADLEKLEWDVKQIAQKVVNYRATLPDKLKSTFANILNAQRPVGADGLESWTSGAPNQQDGAEQVISSKVAALDKDEQDTAEKVQLLKDKICSIVTMPTVLKRMKDCISAIDKLESDNRVIHPAFKRKKAS